MHGAVRKMLEKGLFLPSLFPFFSLLLSEFLSPVSSFFLPSGSTEDRTYHSGSWCILGEGPESWVGGRAGVELMDGAGWGVLCAGRGWQTRHPWCPQQEELGHRAPHLALSRAEDLAVCLGELGWGQGPF